MTPTSTFPSTLLSALINALAFFILYRAFSAQVQLLEAEIKHVRQESVKMKNQMTVLRDMVVKRGIMEEEDDDDDEKGSMAP